MMTGMVLMDVKEEFDLVGRNELIRKIEVIWTDGDLVRWT